MKFKSITPLTATDKICGLLGEQYRPLVNEAVTEHEPSEELKLIIRDFTCFGPPSMHFPYWKKAFESNCYRSVEKSGLKFCIQVLAQLYDNEQHLTELLKIPL